MNEIDRVECRPTKASWLPALLCCGLVLLVLGTIFRPQSLSRDDLVMFFWSFVIFGSGPAFLLYHQFKHYVVADESGIRWREFGREKRASWSEVTRYYHRVRESGVIETQHDKISLYSLNNQSALREMVQRLATNAETKQWEMRSQNSSSTSKTVWPQTFVYRPHQSRNSFLFTLIYATAWSWIWIWISLRKHGTSLLSDIRQTAEIASALSTTLFALLVLGLLFGLPCLIVVLQYRMWREAQRHRDEKVEMNENGIEYSKGDKTLYARWDEVQRIVANPKLGGTGFKVETTHGDFNVSPSIARHEKLLSLLARSASRAELVTHEDEQTDVQYQQTSQTFGFKTECNWKSLLWFWLFSFSPLIYVPFVTDKKLAPFIRSAPSVESLLFICGALIIIAILFTLSCCRSHVTLDEEGFSYRSLWSKKHLRWNDISRYGLSSLGFLLVESAEQRVAFSARLSGKAQLKREIAQRATNAQTTSWQVLE